MPDDVGFATRSELAADMITAAVEAGTPVAWAAADEAYGNSGGFRAHLRGLRLGYVLAVSRSHLVPLDGGKTRLRADRIAAGLPASAWRRRSAGAGSKGPRFYDWAWLDEVTTDADPDDDGRHSLLIRRNTGTGELAFYRCWTPTPATLAQLVRVALLAPLRHPGHGRFGRPGHLRRRRSRTRRRTRRRHRPAPPRRPDQTDGQRDPPPDQRLRHPPDQEPRPSFALVRMRRRHQARARRSHYKRRVYP
ncbi:MAG TPA: transposase [Micromonosporaceae bacterium]|nr:transposase [Micromonosporaceae bacterium]